MSISGPFIRRPVGTILLAIGLMLAGLVAYRFLPVASLPSVDLPTIRVNTGRPGADPVTMAATVAAPLERRLGEIAGVNEITSTSTLGSASITLQFDFTRDIDGAARDVQAALNAAATDLPGDLPNLPSFRKVNPNAMPILILALTSDTLEPSALYDAADTVIAQRISQLPGVAEVNVSGSEQPAIRIRVNPARLAAMGTSLEDIRAAIANTNALGATGSIDGPDLARSIGANEQVRRVPNYADLMVKTGDGTGVRLGAVATIQEGTRNSRGAAWYEGKPSVLLMISKQANANVIETVDRVRALLPELKRWVPAGISISVLSDRTGTIRASVEDMEWTLVATIGLVMMVVFLFLRRMAATVAAGVTVPLALSGTFAAMWLAGFSIDNLSLMALAVSVGFVVDDAIVMIENVDRNLAAGMAPMDAALEGSRQIGFTVVAISLSLLAAFIPLMMMGGIVGRFFREFAWTLAFAILFSTVVSLTLTPSICAHWLRLQPDRPKTWLDRTVEGILAACLGFYARTLAVVLRHRALTMLVMAGTVAATVALYIATPKGFLPQDDTGLVMGWSEAATDISFPAMVELQKKVDAIVRADPAVAGVGSSAGGGGYQGVNSGRMYINLKPMAERQLSTPKVIERLRKELAAVPGIRVYLGASQDVRIGGRAGRSQYQFTLWSPDFAELDRWAPQVLEKVKTVPGLVDVSSDREQGGLEARVIIDRPSAARLGVKIQDIDNALNNAFAQRQISTLYFPRNQYRVVLEVEPRFRRDPSDITALYVPGAGGTQVPLSAVARVERKLAPLEVNHQGPYPSVTITYALAVGANVDVTTQAIDKAVAEMHLPDTVHAEFAGEARAFGRQANSQPLLILAALATVYIVLGVLYESLAHPLTIISTLPAAGLGALLALQVTGSDLSLIAFIGIVLLIGIVKKNGIMLVDFALEAERKRGLAPRDAIFEACLERFRPILMTTMASLLGAIPLLVATGAGSELRRPLGITIVGGLIVSQVLTLYTTPVVYLLLDRLHHRWSRKRPVAGGPQAVPAPAE
ncbi:MAG: efflux RND transporter permease subunit [Alsobacter sp.]